MKAIEVALTEIKEKRVMHSHSSESASQPLNRIHT
jgi:hypothetical protein